MIDEGASYSIDTNQKLKDFFVYRLKSPLTIFGLVIVVIYIIIALFPQILTPYSIQEALYDIFLGAWNPPSETHPLGQTGYGRDVLAITAYGISLCLKVCTITVLIGFAIGVLFGYLTKLHDLIKYLVMVFIIFILIVPFIILIQVYTYAYGIDNIIIKIILMAICLIPGITFLIGQGNYSLELTIKKIIVYFPLFMAIIILIFESIGLLSLNYLSDDILGINILNAKSRLFLSPWASLWPSIAIYVLIIGFLSLHYGLKEPIPVVRRKTPNMSTKENDNLEKED